MTTQEEIPFTKEMRAATREAHDLSNALVNAKLAFALSDNKVWAEGLLIFYEIFKFLEENAPETILPKEYHRHEAFEKDLDYFLGKNWKDDYTPRLAVQDYLAHLAEVKKEDPIILLAYVFHLYMGLMSGTQILQKKRLIEQRLMNPLSASVKLGSTDRCGSEATHFEGHTLADLKREMRSNIDGMAHDFDEKTKIRILEEGLKVFELNDKIMRTVKGVNRVHFKKVIIAVLFCMLSYMVFKMVVS